MRWRMAILVGAWLSSPGVWGSVVAAQVPEDALVAGGPGQWMLGTVLTREDGAMLVEAAGLQEAQAEAVGELIDGARERLAANRRRFHRQYAGLYRKQELGEVDDKAMSKQLRELERAARTEATAVERSLMADLKAVLTSEQEAGWEKFVRSRRRVQLGFSEVELKLDVVLAVRAIGVDVKARPDLAAALEVYEREVDAALVALRPVADKWAELQRNFGSSQDEGVKAYRAMVEASWAVQQVQTRGFRAVMGRLPEEDQRALMRLRIRSAGRMAGVSTDMGVMELVRLEGLSAEQQERMRRICEEAERAWLQEMNRVYAKVDDATLAATSAEQMESRENVDQTRKVSARLTDRLIKDLIEVLMPAQKERYDSGLGVREDGTPGMEEELRMPVEKR